MRRRTGTICTLLAVQALSAASASHAAEPIRIGVVNEITGSNAEAGSYTVNGARLAVEEINRAGGLLGRQIELRVEDNQSTNPGTVLAFSKLFGEGGIAAVIGPVRSTQVQAAAPTIMKAGVPVLIGGTDPGLTKAGNRWLFRARPNDSYSAQGDRGFRGQHAQAQEVGDPAFDRHLRHRREERAASRN